MLVRLTRAPVWRTEDGLDVTKKSGTGIGKMLSPTWDMVMGSKNGTMPSAEYKRLYHEILNGTAIAVFNLLHQLGQRNADVLTFLCYCKDGEMGCHTYLLMDYLIERFPELFTY
jgi:hypothetical protein